MILKPSVQNKYDAFFSRDPAFIKPPVRGDEDDAAWKKIAAEYKHKWTVARETGDLSSVLADNGQPTRFVMRQIPGDQMAKLVGWYSADPRSVRKVEYLEFFRLLVRCALVSIEGLGFEHEIKQSFYEGLGNIVSVDTTNLLDGIDFAICNELAEYIQEKQTLSPKS